jgi:protein-L-isoaspartate(D-aspartate) O-methyltransferase
VAKLLQGLAPRAGEQALAIAAPYAAAVLEAMGLVGTRVDGEDPTAVSGRYQVVVCEGAVTEPPAAWTEALAANGRLGVVVRDGPVGRAMLYVPADGGVGRRDLFDTAPPLMAGFEPKAAFAF